MSIELEDMIVGEWYGIMYTYYEVMLSADSAEGSKHNFRVSGCEKEYYSLTTEHSYHYMLGLVVGLGVESVCLISLKEEHDKLG